MTVQTIKAVLRSFSLLCVLSLLLCALLASSAAQNPATPAQSKPAFRDGVVLVGFKAGTAPEEIIRVLSKVGAHELRVIGQDVHVVHVPAGRVQQTIDALRKFPAVR